MSFIYHWSAAQFVCVLALSLAFSLWQGFKAPKMTPLKGVGVAAFSVFGSLATVALASAAFA